MSKSALIIGDKFGFYPIGGGTGISLLLFPAKVVVKAKYPAGDARIVQKCFIFFPNDVED